MTSISAANNTSVMTIAGTYYFPNSSKSQPLHLAFDEQGTLSLPAFENEVESKKKYSFDQCKVSEPLGSAPRFIDFPDGGRFESSDHGGFALLSKTIKASSKKSIESWVDALERRWSMVAASVVALVLFSFFRSFFYAACDLSSKRCSKSFCIKPHLQYPFYSSNP